ncbi:MAG: ABC transporter [Alphaproteobacteria bacterium 32-64-14]|nr:MAG: ABC transporter [Alphaproteobacteria bacterium 32-64-14]
MKLEASNISVSARGRTIIHDAGLSLSSGEFVGLIGPNGAGKSTLLRALLGLTPRDSGQVALDGADFSAMPAASRARAVAFLPQDRRVEWRLTAHDVIMLGRYPHRSGFGGATAADRDAVQRAIAMVEAEALVDRPVSVLSGGERTRILLARALAVEAPLLLADEPVTALDPYHQLHVMEILRERTRSGAGVLAVIHDLALAARFMDRLVLMEGGSVLVEGPPAEVLAPERLAKAYSIAALAGAHGGEPYILPWSRL